VRYTPTRLHIYALEFSIPTPRQSISAEVQHKQQNPSPQVSPSLINAMLTLCVSREQRLFAAHDDVLCNSPYFASLYRNQFSESTPSYFHISMHSCPHVGIHGYTTTSLHTSNVSTSRCLHAH